MPTRKRTSTTSTKGVELRIGLGYDVHRLTSGRPFILGGIRIPSPVGLDGHSDADVLLHAICDALLGSAALGDIGIHFPNSSRKYKGVSSLILLGTVRTMLLKAGYVPVNIDATVILETPKIARFSTAMRKAIAHALELSPSSVSVKATTNEGLGTIGRREGCAAMAIALVRSVR